MKKFIPVIVLLSVLSGCLTLQNSNPYERSLCTLTVKAVYPGSYSSATRAGVPVEVEDINQGSRYLASTGEDGTVSLQLLRGLYRITVQDEQTIGIFNGSVDRYKFTRDGTVEVPLSFAKTSRLVFKEIYCGGCMKTPEQGTYQADQYAILHNNSAEDYYLDKLCIGTLAPYNSNSNNPYGNPPADYLPVIQSVWQFPGDGRSFPLKPGEDAVVCFRGAIDHSKTYPESVNLNKEGYFVCYNQNYFPNPSYHPTPGDRISSDHYLDVVIKVGQANAYTLSINSPVLVAFTEPADTSMRDYVNMEGAIEQLPGSNTDRVVKVPFRWVEDAVEVFNGSSSSNSKRLLPSLDAGYITLSGTYLGHTLFRYTDEEKSGVAGYEVLKDSNNSSVDFYERTRQSLHD